MHNKMLLRAKNWFAGLPYPYKYEELRIRSHCCVSFATLHLVKTMIQRNLQLDSHQLHHIFKLLTSQITSCLISALSGVPLHIFFEKRLTLIFVRNTI